jgi:precorrin-6y C5,15-methyltransferase (decarboxylating) CbiE subunit
MALTVHPGAILPVCITIVGCGPGALDYVTPAAQAAIAEAEVLAGAARLLELFPAAAAERMVVGGDIPAALDHLSTLVGNRKVVVLVTGDPGVRSLAQPVIARFGRDRCNVIPGISSVQVAFARLGLDWTDARLISAHHHLPDMDFAALAAETKIAVLVGGASSLPWLLELARTLEATHALFLCQDLTLPREQVTCLTADQLAGWKLSPQSILLLVEKKLWT